MAFGKLFAWGKKLARGITARQEANARVKSASQKTQQYRSPEHESIRARIPSVRRGGAGRVVSQYDAPPPRLSHDDDRFGGVSGGSRPPTGLIEPNTDDRRFGTTGHSILSDVEQGDEMSVSDAEAFLRGEMTVFADSTMVDWFKYVPDSQQLIIKYKDKGNKVGPTWAYAPYSQAEAAAFFAASSKGSATWSMIRVRGTLRGHHKSAWRIA